MFRLKKINKYFFGIFLFLIITFKSVYAEEEAANSTLTEIIKQLQGDIKTLEKAVYSSASVNQSTTSLSTNDEDALTRHLLKLNEIEEQFQSLTNKFEEVNFKIDKLSNRITKIQSDNQMRFNDLENGQTGLDSTKTSSKQKKLPGSSEPQDLGTISESAYTNTKEEVQQTKSIETTSSVITENTQRAEKLLPETNPEGQYEFAISFLKVGDYANLLLK